LSFRAYTSVYAYTSVILNPDGTFSTPPVAYVAFSRNETTPPYADYNSADLGTNLNNNLIAIWTEEGNLFRFCFYNTPHYWNGDISECDYYFQTQYIGGGLFTEWTSTSAITPKIYTFTYSTTTSTANITGYWEATTTPYITQQLSFWQFSDTLGKEAQQSYTATTTGFFNLSFYFLDPYAFTSSSTATTTQPIFSNFTLNASLDQYDETNNVFPYGGEIITNLDATSTEVFASEYNASDFVYNCTRDLTNYPEYECSISSLTGCFKNALVWTFYPTQCTIDNWNGLQTKIQTKAPVGYFYMIKNSISGLSATGTKAFNVVIPSSLKQYIFTPFDTGIAAMLWFFFVFNFYKRLKHITI
jgi:hypothetical protein